MKQTDVIKMRRERLGQVVILSHHLSRNNEPYIDYVNEKKDIMPSLDSNNKAVFEQLALILKQKYGVVIEYRYW